MRNQFDWWSALGDGTVGTRNGIKRLIEGKRCEPHTAIYYPSDPLHERSGTEGSTTEQSATLVSAVDHMMQEVNYIDRRYATVDIANR